MKRQPEPDGSTTVWARIILADEDDPIHNNAYFNNQDEDDQTSSFFIAESLHVYRPDGTVAFRFSPAVSPHFHPDQFRAYIHDPDADDYWVSVRMHWQGWAMYGRLISGKLTQRFRMRRTKQSYYLHPPPSICGVKGNKRFLRLKNPVLDLIDGMWRVSDGDQVRWWAKTFSNGQTYWGLEPADIINQRIIT